MDVGLLAAVAGTLAVSYCGIKLLCAFDAQKRAQLCERVDALVSTAGQEIDAARRVFQPDFEEKRAELQELIEWVRNEFGVELAKNTREMYWIRMLLRTHKEECQWLASLLGSLKGENACSIAAGM